MRAEVASTASALRGTTGLYGDKAFRPGQAPSLVPKQDAPGALMFILSWPVNGGQEAQGARRRCNCGSVDVTTNQRSGVKLSPANATELMGFVEMAEPRLNGHRWLRPREFEAWTRIPRQRVRRHAKAGKIPGARKQRGRWYLPVAELFRVVRSRSGSTVVGSEHPKGRRRGGASGCPRS